MRRIFEISGMATCVENDEISTFFRDRDECVRTFILTYKAFVKELNAHLSVKSFCSDLMHFDLYSNEQIKKSSVFYREK